MMSVMIKLSSYLVAIPLFPGVDTNDIIGSVPKILAGLINIAIFVAGGLSVIFLIVGALRMVLSAGSPTNVVQARKTITYAVLGLILSLLAVAIVAVINPGSVGRPGSGIIK